MYAHMFFNHDCYFWVGDTVYPIAGCSLNELSIILVYKLCVNATKNC